MLSLFSKSNALYATGKLNNAPFRHLKVRKNGTLCFPCAPSKLAGVNFF